MSLTAAQLAVQQREALIAGTAFLSRPIVNIPGNTIYGGLLGMSVTAIASSAPTWVGGTIGSLTYLVSSVVYTIFRHLCGLEKINLYLDNLLRNAIVIPVGILVVGAFILLGAPIAFTTALAIQALPAAILTLFYLGLFIGCDNPLATV